MSAQWLRGIATELEHGMCRVFMVDTAMQLAYAIIGEKAYPCPEIGFPDEREMLILWLAVAVLEDQERTKRIDDAIATLRELCQ